jgi:hypothetical protein
MRWISKFSWLIVLMEQAMWTTFFFCCWIFLLQPWPPRNVWSIFTLRHAFLNWISPSKHVFRYFLLSYPMPLFLIFSNVTRHWQGIFYRCIASYLNFHPWCNCW